MQGDSDVAEGIGSVGEFMSSQNLHTASPGDHIVDIAADMLKHKIRRRPVIDSDATIHEALALAAGLGGEV